jgi:hypothetical protein
MQSVPAFERVGAVVLLVASSLLMLPRVGSAQAGAGTARYTISVTFDPATRRVEGTERVRWRNTSHHPVSEVRLRLGTITPSAISVTGLGAGPSNEDQSILQVQLLRPLAPGSEIDLDVRWTATAEVGWGGTFVFADWFPQALNADSGYSDYGTYDVSIQVPAPWQIAATGREQAPSTAWPTARHFVQASVGGCGWATGQNWVERRARIDRENESPVDLRLLLQPEHARQADRMVAAVKVALANGRRSLAPYSYDTLTILDLPWRSRYGQLALPTLVTTSLPWLEPRFASDTELEVARGLARHFWRQTIGGDVARWPWFFAPFEADAANRLADPIVASQLDSTLGRPFLVTRLFAGFVPYIVRSIRLERPIGGDDARDGGSGGSPAWVGTLERYLGWPTFEAIMTTFSERFRFGHPAPQDFFDTAESVSGRDLRWFFEQIGDQPREFEYGVDEVTSRQSSDGRYHSRIVIGRHGDGIFSGTSHPRVGPYESGRAVELAIDFDDRLTRAEYWDGRDRQKAFLYESVAPVKRVVVDPNGVLLLDRNITKSSWVLRPRAASAANRWALRWMTWIEDLIVGSSFLA